ncbi:N-acetylmuramoyl-L-alanine amidase [Actinomycetaceae bacterium MB13-C1-2]|nr:N-acetylmuramoyl-L-alanine amidase [Actinomycetaceae bacterium MB13-C1-2]
MATLQRTTSRLILKKAGATVVTGALAFGSLALVTTDAGATESASPSTFPTAPFLSTTEIATLFMNQVDPVVVDPETTELDFADAVIDESYTETGPVTEEQGDRQQVEAVEQALQEQTVEESKRTLAPDTQGIARIDLEADVAVLGVTWDLGSPQPESVYWRYLTDGMWTEWRTIESEVNQSVDETRGGTEPLTLANVQAVEVVAKTDSGTDVSGLTLHVINAETFAPAENVLLDIYPDQTDEDDAQSADELVEEEDNQSDGPTKTDEDDQDSRSDEPVEADQDDKALDTDELVGTDLRDKALDTDGLVETDGVSFSGSVVQSLRGIQPAVGLNSAGTIYDTGFEGLKIGTRKAWCTGDCRQVSTWTPEPIAVKGAVVHHTEGNNNYTQAQVPQQLRNVYQWQAVSRGWGDIGYNLVVDKYGGVWEGRYGGLTKGIQGAHALGANYDTFGITVLGSYTDSAPPVVARQAMSKAIAWKLNLHGVKSATEKVKVQAQWAGGATVPRVSAHRDVGWTDCPGDAFYKQMDTVRSEVNAYLAKLNAPSSGTTTPSTTTFKPGNVISDAVFYNPNAMTESQIKSFIESAGASCKSSGSSKCLKDMTFPTSKLNPIRVKTGGCSALNLSGSQRPWTIIDKTAKACGLNPQVILVTLQKEQSGLTQPKTDAVWAKAMGAGCPDGSGCDAAQAGFAKQVYYGAEKLATYKINATWEQYILAFQNGQSVTVQNNAGTACGSQTFKLENYATASLYMYTPYVGNGTGANCPAIGQKMFWDLMKRYFPASSGGDSSNNSPTPVEWSGSRQIGNGWPAQIVYAGDWNGDSRPDLMLVDSNKNLRLYAGGYDETFAMPVVIGNGWGKMDWIQGGVDWDGDGNNDILARHSLTGALHLYRGDGKGGWAGSRVIGQGWGGMSKMALVQLGSRPAIYGIKGDTLHFYLGDGNGGFASSVNMGSGWSSVTAMTGVGHWGGGGTADLVVREKSGNLFRYTASASGTLSGKLAIGQGWNGMVAIGSASQKDFKSSLWAVHSDGRLFSYGVR